MEAVGLEKDGYVHYNVKIGDRETIPFLFGAKQGQMGC